MRAIIWLLVSVFFMLEYSEVAGNVSATRLSIIATGFLAMDIWEIYQKGKK